jgi:hypothetical protein
MKIYQIRNIFSERKKKEKKKPFKHGQLGISLTFPPFRHGVQN